MMLTEVTKKKKSKARWSALFRGETKTHLSLYFLKTSFAQLLAQANFFAILIVFSMSVIYLFAKQVPDKGILKKSRN